LKFKKEYLILIGSVLIFLMLWSYFFWYPDFVMNQHIEELKSKEINVQMIIYSQYYEDMTTVTPSLIFAEKLDWSSFKQNVLDAEVVDGPVTVLIDSTERIFVFTWNQTITYYKIK